MTSPLPLPPGSLGLPGLGETLAWAANAFTFMDKRFRAHGPIFKTRILGEKVVCCVGPEAMEKFLDDRYVAREGATPRHLEQLIGPGTLPFVDGELQRRNKRLMLAAFGPAAMAGYVAMAAPIVERAVERWEGQGSFRWVPELEVLVLRIFDTVFRSAPPDADDVELRRDLEAFLAGILALPLPLPWSTYRRALRARDRLLATISNAVAARRAEPKDDVIGRLLAARDEKGEGLGDDRVAAEMLHVFFAGYGAMVSALAFLAIALAENPAVAAAARAEVQRVTPSGPIELAQLDRLEVVDRLWREVLRHDPIVPHTGFGRVVQGFTCYGYRVPQGWKLTAVIRGALTNPASFPQPERFDLDRFLPGAADPRRPLTFVPQGGGPPDSHRCLGENLSAAVAKLAVVAWLRHHDWTLETRPVEIDLRLFPPRPIGGLPVRFFRRDAATA